MWQLKLKGFFKNLFYFIVVIIVFLLLSLAVVQYDREKQSCLRRNCRILTNIAMAVQHYVEYNKELAPKLNLLKTSPYWDAGRINDWKDPDRTIVSRLFIEKTELEKHCSFLYNPNIDIKETVSGDFIVASEPFSTDGYRFVAFLKPGKGKWILSYSVQQIPEKEFQEIAKRYKWKLPYTKREDALDKINSKISR